MAHEPDLTSAGPLIPAGRHHAFLQEARELLRLAVPLAATQLAQMIILATDTVMLGHFSKEALAGACRDQGARIGQMIDMLGHGPAHSTGSRIAPAPGYKKPCVHGTSPIAAALN